MADFESIAKDLGRPLQSLPPHWDGKAAILEMKNDNFPQWKQMEWIGFYFEYLCRKYLKGTLEFPGPKYGRVGFDGFRTIPWDLKVHVSNNPGGGTKVIVNDSRALALGIQQFGSVGLFLAVGAAIYNDENRSFQLWHERLKGGPTPYVKARIKRGAPSRIRKTVFQLASIIFIKIDDELLESSGTFQKGFRNSDGNPRATKMLLDLNGPDAHPLHSIHFH